MKYVLSTMSSAIRYVEYDDASVKDKNRLPRQVRSVVIKGGANVATKALVTPSGVVTEVSDDDALFLERNADFKRHAAAGFVKLLKSEPNVDKAVRDMTPKDKSAPALPGDFTKPPKVSATAT